jgi:hypothetical protein
MVPVKQGGTLQLLVSADAVNLLGESMYTKKNTEASKEGDLPKLNIFMLHEQNEGQYNNIKVNKSFQSVADF